MIKCINGWCADKETGCRPATCPICGHEWCDVRQPDCPACGWSGEEEISVE